MKTFVFFGLCCILIFGCRQSKIPGAENTGTGLSYAKQIGFKEINGEIHIESGGETTTFDTADLPLESVMVVPAAVNAYLDALGLTDKITGLSEPDYVFNENVRNLIRQKKIETIGNYNELLIEKIMINKPGVFVSTSNPNLAKFHAQLEKEGIKIIYIDEYLEDHPLGKSEYLKIFGKLFGKEKEAEKLFGEIEENYKSIKSKVELEAKSEPAILASGMYGDVWYMPGGNSFQAKFFADAGGGFLWKNDIHAGTLNLSFEEVFEKGNNADIWVNAGDFDNLEDLAASYPNYKWFSAYKNKQVFNWGKRKNETGANDYFEMGTVRPDWVLKDLATIFHPELFPEHELRFYKKLE